MASPGLSRARLTDLRIVRVEIEALAASWGVARAVDAELSNYATFSGRAARSEFWCFTHFSWLASLVAGFVDAGCTGGPENGTGTVGVIVALAPFLPGLAVSAQRLRDVDRTAWWMPIMLITIVGWIVLLVFCCTRGTMSEPLRVAASADRCGRAVGH